MIWEIGQFDFIGYIDLEWLYVDGSTADIGQLDFIDYFRLELLEKFGEIIGNICDVTSLVKLYLSSRSSLKELPEPLDK